MKSLELQQWNTMKALSGVKATYRSGTDSFKITVVPRGTRQLRYGFAGQPLSADARVFVVLKKDIPEPQNGDTIEFHDEVYEVSRSEGVPCWIPYGRFGVLLKIHTTRKGRTDDD